MSDQLERVARAIYARRFPSADVAEHFEWHARGAHDPGSCVHYSTVSEAIRDARAAIAAMREHMTEKRGHSSRYFHEAFNAEIDEALK